MYDPVGGSEDKSQISELINGLTKEIESDFKELQHPWKDPKKELPKKSMEVIVIRKLNTLSGGASLHLDILYFSQSYGSFLEREWEEKIVLSVIGWLSIPEYIKKDKYE